MSTKTSVKAHRADSSNEQLTDHCWQTANNNDYLLKHSIKRSRKHRKKGRGNPRKYDARAGTITSNLAISFNSVRG